MGNFRNIGTQNENMNNKKRTTSLYTKALQGKKEVRLQKKQ